MKPLYTNVDFEKTKSEDLLPFECYQCKNSFLKKKKTITASLKNTIKDTIKFCSTKCKKESQKTKQKINCTNCQVIFEKFPNQIKKTNKHFCSRSCSATYNNTHKTHGIRRSKLEVYLEEQLTLAYPNLVIDFNKKDTINSELDIYIPSLKLAFELNGIYHYEPIHGEDKLKQIQNNDQRKFQACLEKNIELALIDTSTFSYFKKERANNFLNIIKNIINNKIS